MNIKLHHMIWYTASYNGHGFTIIWIIVYGQKFMIGYDGPWIQWLFCEVIVTTLLLAWAT